MSSDLSSKDALAGDSNPAKAFPAACLKPDFVRDLIFVSTELDLQKVAKNEPGSIGGVNAAALAELDALLTAARNEVSGTLQSLTENHLKAFPDSPVFCPVTLFGPIDYGRLETAVTRALAWILDPDAEHGWGMDALHAVLAHLPAYSSGESEPKPAPEPSLVQAEYAVAEGRIDVIVRWNEAGGRALLIEAKIDASEQPKQAHRYAQWAKKQKLSHHWLLYLTPNGKKPTTSGSRANTWIAASYVDLVRWLIPMCRNARGCEGFPFLRLFLAGLLKDVCHWELMSSSPPRGVNRFALAQILACAGASHD